MWHKKQMSKYFTNFLLKAKKKTGLGARFQNLSLQPLQAKGVIELSPWHVFIEAFKHYPSFFLG